MNTIVLIALLAPTATTLTVDTDQDPAINLSTPVTNFCTAAPGDCSLRQAIRRQNGDTATVYVIQLAASEYKIALGVISVRARPLTLLGAASGGTVLNATSNGGNKIFSFDGASGQQTITLQDITFRDA